MGTTLKRWLVLLLLFSLVSTEAHAATKPPTPKPTTKISTKIVKPKSSIKPSTQATAKATIKNQPTAKGSAQAKVSARPNATKKSPTKKVVRKTKRSTRVSASPKPSWPPAGFYTDKAGESDVYAHIPTKKELIGVSSAKPSLAERILECEKLSCGAVQVASYIGCSWWEITSTLYRSNDNYRSRVVVGNLRTLVGKSAPQQILTILLISKEPVAEGLFIDNIVAACHRDTPTEDFPQYNYTPA